MLAPSSFPWEERLAPPRKSSAKIYIGNDCLWWVQEKNPEQRCNFYFYERHTLRRGNVSFVRAKVLRKKHFDHP